MGEKLDFFSPLGFEAKSDFDHKTSKLKSHLIRASERYLNDKNPIMVEKQYQFFDLVQETFESDFSEKAGCCCCAEIWSTKMADSSRCYVVSHAAGHVSKGALLACYT